MKLNKSVILIGLQLIFVSSVSAEEKQPNWNVENLGDKINSKYHDGWSTITDDQLTLYFASNRPGGFVDSNIDDTWILDGNKAFTKYDMYVAHRKSIDDPWDKPLLLPEPINSKFNDHSASVSPDGHFLFFASSRPGGCGGLDLYVSHRDDVNDDMSWKKPKNLGCEKDGGVNTENIDSCPVFFTDKNGIDRIYFTAASSPNPMSLDFKYATFNKTEMTLIDPKTMDISTEFLDGHIDPKFGYVWGGYPQGLGGSDIYKSTKQANGEWGEPINLGNSLNTEYEEQLPSPVNDGKVIYFPSNRPGGNGGMDIYIATQK